jgi:hypothetical protein
MNAMTETVPVVTDAPVPDGAPASVAPDGAPASGVAMTVAEVLGEITRLKAAIGQAAEIYMSVGHRYDGNSVAITVWPNGMGSGAQPVHCNGKDWLDAFAHAHTWLETNGQELRESTIRRLALAIIDLTDRNGTATYKALIQCGFSREEIAEFHQTACDRAAKMIRPCAVVMA